MLSNISALLAILIESDVLIVTTYLLTYVSTYVLLFILSTCSVMLSRAGTVFCVDYSEPGGYGGWTSVRSARFGIQHCRLRAKVSIVMGRLYDSDMTR